MATAATIHADGSITSYLARWGNIGLAVVAGFALAYKPTYTLWGAGAPWVLDVYQNVSIGAGDVGLALVAACGWLGQGRALPAAARALAFVGIALLACPALSITAAQAPPLGFAALAQCASGLLAALGLARRPALGRWLLLGGSGALLVQAPFVALQLLTQSTFPAGRIFNGLPQETPAAVSGAAVFIGPNGLRWQRALGTFPHPNVLGGFIAIGLVLGLPALLRATRPDRRLVPLAALGWLLLLLTGSRGALLAALLGCGLQIVGWRTPAGRTLLRLAAPPLAAAALAALLLGPALVSRLSIRSVSPSAPSVQERGMIADVAWTMIRSHPLRGVGAGNFTLAELQPPFNAISVEPAHAVPLLVAAEAGVLAGLAWLALLIAPLAVRWRHTRRLTPAQLAIPVALLALALLDHYLWTFGSGRALFWLAVGGWLGTDLTPPPADGPPLPRGEGGNLAKYGPFVVFSGNQAPILPQPNESTSPLLAGEGSPPQRRG